MAVHAHGALTSKGSFARIKQALKKSGLVQHRASSPALENAWNFHPRTFLLPLPAPLPCASARGWCEGALQHTYARALGDLHFVLQPRNRFAIKPRSKFGAACSPESMSLVLVGTRTLYMRANATKSGLPSAANFP